MPLGHPNIAAAIGIAKEGGGQAGRQAGHHMVGGLFDRPIMKCLESGNNIASSSVKMNAAASEEMKYIIVGPNGYKVAAAEYSATLNYFEHFCSIVEQFDLKPIKH